MAEDFDPISEADAERRIEELQNLDTESQSIDELKAAIDKTNLKIKPVTLKEGAPLYRARTFKERPGEVRELNYPFEDDARLSRANRGDDPVFYASISARTPLFEIDPDPGEKVAILKWETTEELTLGTIGYDSTVFNRLGSTRNPEELPWYEMDGSESRGNLLLRKYLANLFTLPVSDDGNHHYKLTTAIAEKWRSGNALNGIMYPAVEMQANGDNVAIETEAVDQSLTSASAEYIQIQENQEAEIERGEIDTCTTFQNEELQWNGHGTRFQLEDPGAWVELKAMNGRWKVADSGQGGASFRHDPDFHY